MKTIILLAVVGVVVGILSFVLGVVTGVVIATNKDDFHER